MLVLVSSQYRLRVLCSTIVAPPILMALARRQSIPPDEHLPIPNETIVASNIFPWPVAMPQTIREVVAAGAK